MPSFVYKGRDREGRLREGQRVAVNIDALNSDLIKEGISPTNISEMKPMPDYWSRVRGGFQSEALHLEELAIFSRQMELLQHAGVPIITSLKQLATFTRSRKLANALDGIIEHLQSGQDLATAMQYYPEAFPQLMTSIIQIGESTGHLSEAFGHLHAYLEFESRTIKQLKASFRYPMFVGISILAAIIILNVFVIPTFARFYANVQGTLPWQTRILIGFSNFIVNYGIYTLILMIIGGVFLYRYLHTPKGKYQWNKFQIRIPVFGKLSRRIILIRFCQSLAVVLNSGIGVTQGLVLVKNVLNNAYIGSQITEMQELIERGTSFTQAISKVELFTPLELQILSVGEKSGEIGPALTYIGNFHAHEIEYDLKRLNDFIGPALITVVAVLVLIIALGVYLPIWNMINLVHS